MILDPTSVTMKNVTPHCSQIQEVLEFFKRSSSALDNIQKIVLDRIESGSLNSNPADIEKEIRSFVDEKFRGKANLLAKVLRILDCNDSLTVVKNE